MSGDKGLKVSEGANIIHEFRQTITPNLLAQDDLIDWDAIGVAVEKSGAAIQSLETYRASGDLSKAALANALRQNPGIYDVVLSLIAFNTSGSQITKWGLPATVPNDVGGCQHLAGQLLHIGLDRVLAGSAPIEDLLRIAEIYKDSFRRRFRSGSKVDSQTAAIVRKAVIGAGNRLGTPLRIGPDSLTDIQLHRSLDFIIASEIRPIAGVATVFQNQSGGRQQRDLSVTYPLLQQRLSDHGMALILIADGQGLREASDRTLSQLFDAVRFPMNIEQAVSGMLEDAIVEAGVSTSPVPIDNAAIARLITGALDVRSKVTAEELPVTRSRAILALARYAENHKDLGTSLSTAGDELRWNNPDAVAAARSLQIAFEPSQAIDLLVAQIGAQREAVVVEGGILRTTLVLPETPPFKGRVVTAASREALTPELTRTIGLRALEEAPGSSIALLITAKDLIEHEIESHRKRQAILPANIIIVGPGILRAMTEAKSPIQALVNAVLEQSDLTKVSPFVLSNATPTRMFYGRETEAATILRTLGTNSVALLGSRRIGKTSLLRWVRSELEAANFLPFFGDCQTVRTWEDFAVLAQTEWHVEVPSDFRPQHLASVIKRLAGRSGKQVVILLDEIDQLLEWDRTHTEDSVPEAFFRGCRSVSQEGVAQFVFSGERNIAQRIWDPQSPHWNFCRPLALSQLTREAATALLIRPLNGMNITIVNEHAFGEEAWRRTSGHPQIVQFLGDRLIRLLDEKPDRRSLTLSSEDIKTVSDTYEFAEHYLLTYWGQANSLEREISIEIAKHQGSLGSIQERICQKNPKISEHEFAPAMRMLQLYGIVREEDDIFSLRAAWFRDALAYFDDGFEVKNSISL